MKLSVFCTVVVFFSLLLFSNDRGNFAVYGAILFSAYFFDVVYLAGKRKYLKATKNSEVSSPKQSLQPFAILWLFSLFAYFVGGTVGAYFGAYVVYDILIMSFA